MQDKENRNEWVLKLIAIVFVALGMVISGYTWTMGMFVTKSEIGYVNESLCAMRQDIRDIKTFLMTK